MCGCGKSGSQQSGSSQSTARAQGVSLRPPTSAHVADGRGAGNRTSTDQARDARATHYSAATTVHSNEVQLRYRGTRALLVRGPVTGVGYACYPGDTISVHERDVPQLIGSGSFVRAAS